MPSYQRSCDKLPSSETPCLLLLCLKCQ